MCAVGEVSTPGLSFLVHSVRRLRVPTLWSYSAAHNEIMHVKYLGRCLALLSTVRGCAVIIQLGQQLQTQMPTENWLGQ